MAMTITQLSKTCSCVPSEWEGRLADGRELYARYRHGVLRINLGASVEDAINYGTAPLLAAMSLVLDNPEYIQMQEAERERHLEREVRLKRAGLKRASEPVHLQLGDSLDGSLSTRAMLEAAQQHGLRASRQVWREAEEARDS